MTGRRPVADAIMSLARVIWLLTAPGVSRVRSAWVQVWLTIWCPAAATSRASAGSAATLSPIMENVAVMRYRASRASTCGVYTGSGPSSMVRAMTFGPSSRKTMGGGGSSPAGWLARGSRGCGRAGVVAGSVAVCVAAGWLARAAWVGPVPGVAGSVTCLGGAGAPWVPGLVPVAFAAAGAPPECGAGLGVSGCGVGPGILEVAEPVRCRAALVCPATYSPRTTNPPTASSTRREITRLDGGAPCLLIQAPSSHGIPVPAAAGTGPSRKVKTARDGDRLGQNGIPCASALISWWAQLVGGVLPSAYQ